MTLRWAALAVECSFLILFLLSRRESGGCCHGFSLSSITHSVIHLRNRPRSGRHHNLFPSRLEDWGPGDVEDWLYAMGFGRYSRGFAEDFNGIGVDGDRLVYLGTEDQLDHIEYQLSLIGVDDESDQRILGSTIIELVAAAEVTPELLESLTRKVPTENRDQKNDEDDKNGDLGCENHPSYDI